MTTILLSSAAGYSLAPLREVLAGYGLEVLCRAPDAPATAAVQAAAPDWGVLIHPQPGVIPAGEALDRLREHLGPALRLLACVPRLVPEDRQALLACGASEVVSPAGWSTAAVTERVLAELLRVGMVVPVGMGRLCGGSAAMRVLYQQIQVVAPLAEHVLILGETGTGKELVAREVHAASGRRGDLLAINCAALTPDLVESELFGHAKGAFSGAVAERRGLLVEAGEGTVFLDEIGDLAASSQAKLLRVLEEQQVRPVGANRWQPVRARILLATHRDLATACDQGTFRSDLYERIRGFTLELPPLRDRRADLGLLAERFLNEFQQKYPGEYRLPPGALDLLFQHNWPGNVRELRHAVQQAAAYGGNGTVSEFHLQDAIQRRRYRSDVVRSEPDLTTGTWREVHDRVRAHYFRQMLAAADGNKEAAAAKAGISRAQFYEILKKIEQSDPAALAED